MFNTTKIAICLGLMIGASSAALAKDQYTQKGMATSTQKSDGFYSFGQAPGQTRGSCWVPTGDDSGEYGADSRGLGYRGSCGERGAVSTK
jgi:hypothetical protein